MISIIIIILISTLIRLRATSHVIYKENINVNLITLHDENNKSIYLQLYAHNEFHIT